MKGQSIELAKSTSVVDSLPICEMFLSVQGESTHAGKLCFFIRLAGCDLSCSYCDTRYSHNLDSATPTSLDTLLAEAKKTGVSLVEITGGEPLIHEQTPRLCEILMDNGFTVMLETNGVHPIYILPAGVIRILDCKTPSSGHSEAMLTSNYQYLTPDDEVKFVIGDQNDYEYALKMIQTHRLNERTDKIILSPILAQLPADRLVEWMKKDRPPARLGLQIHKFIWPADQRGV